MGNLEKITKLVAEEKLMLYFITYKGNIKDVEAKRLSKLGLRIAIDLIIEVLQTFNTLKSTIFIDDTQVSIIELLDFWIKVKQEISNL